MADSPIILGDVVANDISLEWHEAIAVIQEVCAGLNASSTDAPDPGHIRLEPSGKIELLPGPKSTEPIVQQLGHTLSALLQSAAPPAELRLYVSQMISSIGASTSVDDFSRRLLYFERPGRSRILQLLYERLAPLLDNVQARPAAGLAPKPDAASAKKSTTTARWRAGWLKKAALILVVIAVGALAAFAWQQYRTAGGFGIRVPRVAKSARAVVESSIAGTVSATRSFLNRAGLIDARQVSVDHAPEDTTRARLRQPPAKAKSIARPASDPQPASHSVSEPVPLAEGVPPQSDVTTERFQRSPAATTPDVTVYSASDPDVQPPLLVAPQLPARALEDGADGTPMPPAEVDLLVNENGTVESVKFVSPPERFQQRMIASAIKAWRYQPALKDGQPVRFRLRVKLPL